MQEVFPLFKTDISFTLSRRKFVNQFFLSNSDTVYIRNSPLVLSHTVSLKCFATIVTCPHENTEVRCSYINTEISNLNFGYFNESLLFYSIGYL